MNLKIKLLALLAYLPGATELSVCTQQSFMQGLLYFDMSGDILVIANCFHENMMACQGRLYTRVPILLHLAQQ